MQAFDRLKATRARADSPRTLLQQVYDMTDFQPGELKTRSGYFRMRESVRETVLHSKEKEEQRDQKQRELQADI